MFEELYPGPPLLHRLGLAGPGRAGAPLLRALLAFVAEQPVAGHLVKGIKEAAAELSDETDDRVLERRFDELLALGGRTNEQVRMIEELARAVFEQNAALREFLLARAVPVPDALAEFARAAALRAYRNHVANDLMYADHRGVEGVTRQEHVASLLLDDVYVVPQLLPEREGAPGQDRERDLLHRLLGDTGVSEDRLVQMETEYAVLTGERWRAGSEDEAGAVPLGRVLQGSRHTVVVGGPGVGKSVLTRYVARACALGPREMESRLGWGEDLVPVLVPLALFAEARRERPRLRLRMFVDERMAQRGGGALAAAVDDALSAGRALVLLDGVDEAPEARRREALVQAVDEFIADHAAARVLVTSRPYGYVRLRGEIPHFTLPNFSPEQVDRFVRQWQRAYERRQHPAAPDLEKAEHEANGLLAEIRKNPRVAELAANPLMLVIVSLIRYERTRLPEKRVQLYHRAVNTLMDTWNQWRSQLGLEPGGVALPLDRMIRVWGAVAAWTRRERNTGVVHRAELRRRLVEVLREREYADREAEDTAESYLRAAAGQAGILEERGPDVYAFWHPSFEEFLAGVELATPTSRAADRLVAVADDPRWREVILLAAGYVGVVQRDPETATEIVRALMERGSPPLEGLFHERLRLAAACVADGVGVSRSVAEEIVVRLAAVVARHPHPLFTTALQEVLRTAAGSEPGPRLVSALEPLAVHGPFSIRSMVPAILGRAAGYDPQAREACRRMLADGDTDVRVDAALALARAGEATPEIWHALTHRWQYDVVVPDQARAFLADAPETLWHALEGDLAAADPVRRYRAAVALRTLERVDPRVPQALLELMHTGPGELRLRAAKELRELGRHPEAAAECLRALLRAEGEEDRLDAAIELVRTEPPDEAGVRVLKEIGTAAADRAVRTVALQELQGIGRLDADVVAALLSALRSADPDQRFNAAAQLQVLELHEQEVREAYRGLLSCAALTDRYFAAYLLTELGEHDDAVVEALKRVLVAPVSIVRGIALGKLVQLDQVDGGLLGELRERLHGDDPRDALGAAECLAAFGPLDEGTVNAVRALLHADPHVREQACILLARGGFADVEVREAAAGLLMGDFSRWHTLSYAGITRLLTREQVMAIFKKWLASDQPEAVSWALGGIMARKLVDEDVLRVWTADVAADAAAALGRVLRREPLAPEDAAALARVAPPAENDSPDQRQLRYWLFEWLLGQLSPGRVNV